MDAKGSVQEIEAGVVKLRKELEKLEKQGSDIQVHRQYLFFSELTSYAEELQRSCSKAQG